MPNYRLWIILLALSISTFHTNLTGQNIRLATLTPDNTPWNDALYSMGREWSRETNGDVQLRVYANSIAGSEIDVIRKMRIGQIDAAVLSPVALQSIVPEMLVMNLPFMIETEDELSMVIDEVAPTFNERFAEEGFVVLTWVHNGWVYFFTKNELRTPSDLNSVRLAISPGGENLSEGWRRLGFQAIQTNMSSTLLNLQNDTINCFYSNPIGAISFQWFAFTPYMLDLPVTPVIGAIVVNRRTWQRISVENQVAMLRAANRMKVSFQQSSNTMNRNALTTMQRQGLDVVRLSESEKQEWADTMVQLAYPLVVGEGRSISPQIYDRMEGALNNFRTR